MQKQQKNATSVLKLITPIEQLDTRLEELSKQTQGNTTIDDKVNREREQLDIRLEELSKQTQGNTTIDDKVNRERGITNGKTNRKLN